MSLRYNFPKCFENKHNVGPKGMIGNVFEVDAQLVGHDGLDVISVGVGRLRQQFVFVTIANGCEVGDAGSNVKYVHLLLSI